MSLHFVKIPLDNRENLFYTVFIHTIQWERAALLLGRCVLSVLV